MYQAYERPRTPNRFNANPQQKMIETSPFKEGKPNQKYANPSMISHDVFYDKHYENPNKQLTPAPSPLGIAPNGYGKLTDYKDRYKQISGQNGTGDRTPGTPTANKEQLRSQLRDNYNQKSDKGREGALTPTRSTGERYPQDYQDQHVQPPSGARTPTRREVHPDLHGTRQGAKTPSDQYRRRNQLKLK